MEKICRLCLRQEENMLSVFSCNKEELHSQITNCCSVEISEDDTLPKLVCIGCIEKLEAFYEFRQQCKKSDCILRKHYKVPLNNEFNLNKDKVCQDVYVQTDITNATFKMKKPLSKQAKKISEQDDSDICLDTNDNYNQDDDEMDSSKHLDHIISSTLDSHNSLGTNNKLQVKHTGTRKSNRLKSRQIYMCNFCKKEYESSKALIEHTKLHITEKSTKRKCSRRFKCEICDMPFERKLKLHQHMRIHGKELPAKPKSKKQYLCDICSKTFASKSGLRMHLKTHNGPKPYACQFCNKSFIILSYKKRHEKTHMGNKDYVCHICSASYASSTGFKYHLRLHTGEANYHCEICGKSFRRQKYLKEHTFTHTGERPFICKICGSAYGNSGTLFVHEKKCKSRASTRDRTIFVKEEHE